MRIGIIILLLLCGCQSESPLGDSFMEVFGDRSKYEFTKEVTSVTEAHPTSPAYECLICGSVHLVPIIDSDIGTSAVGHCRVCDRTVTFKPTIIYDFVPE